MPDWQTPEQAVSLQQARYQQQVTRQDETKQLLVCTPVQLCESVPLAQHDVEHGVEYSAQRPITLA